MIFSPTLSQFTNWNPVTSGSVTLETVQFKSVEQPNLISLRFLLIPDKKFRKYTSEIGAIDLVNLFLDRIPYVAIPNYEAVAGYLSRYPDLLPAVLNIAQEALRKIGNQAQYTLEYSKDVEASYEDCWMCVRLPKYPIGIYDELNSINEKFEFVLKDSAGYFRVMTDFQNPRG